MAKTPRKTSYAAVASLVAGLSWSVAPSFAHAATVPAVARVGTDSVPVSDSSGTVWAADRGFTGGWDVPRGTTAPISGTDDDRLYQSEHYGMSAFTTAVPSPGTYRVRLRLAETYFAAAGQRVFDVAAEGQTRLSNVDIYARVGKNTAYDPTFDVPVTDGVLNLAFVNKVNYAKVAAIEVTQIATTPAVARVGTDSVPVSDSTGAVWAADRGFTGGR